MFCGNGNSKVSRTDERTYGQTWVGAREACASKKEFMSEQIRKGRMEQNLKEKTVFFQYNQKRYRTKLSAAGSKRDAKIHRKRLPSWQSILHHPVKGQPRSNFIKYLHVLLVWCTILSKFSCEDRGTFLVMSALCKMATFCQNLEPSCTFPPSLLACLLNSGQGHRSVNSLNGTCWNTFIIRYTGRLWGAISFRHVNSIKLG